MLTLRRSIGEGFAVGDTLVLTLREVRRPHYVALSLRRGLGPTEVSIVPVSDRQFLALGIPGHPHAAVQVEIDGPSSAHFHFDVPDAMEVMRLELLPFGRRPGKAGAA